MSSNNPRHILSVNDLSAAEIDTIFERARQFKEKGFSSSKLFDRYPNDVPIVALAFFEPSTRTKLSFDSAAQRIGCKTIGFDNPASTSSAKGEQLGDTLKTISKYADAIVIRRKDHDTPDIVREAAGVPVISAGVGAQEHPTHGLLDYFTIQEDKNLEEISHVCSYGDLINSRTLFSQMRLLVRPGITFSFVANDDMQIPEDFKKELQDGGAEVICTNNLDDVIADVDVLHVIRPQKERWGDTSLDLYAPVDNSVLAKMKSDAIVMHALPRTGELAEETDSDPRSVIWDQVENGMYVRAALLEWILTNPYH